VCLLGTFNPRRLADSPVESWHGFFYWCMSVARARGLGQGAAVKIEVVCPRGHRIPDDAEGVVSFSMLADERLNVSIECYRCGRRWEMSLRLFTCTERKLSGNVNLNPQRL
jgi:hypothetical protein